MVSRVLLLLFAALLAAGCDVVNAPVSQDLLGRNILFSSYSETPKHLDSVASYSNNETPWTYAIYEPPLKYHYLKRPYELVPRTLESMPVITYLDKAGRVLPADAPGAGIARSVVELRVRRGIRSQPHPAFAADEQGRLLYHSLGEADLAGRLRTAPYAESLREAFGLPDDSPDARWNAAALAALAAFQRSPEVAPFSSKYDAVRRGQARFTRAEARGLRLFSDPAKGNCIACHVFRPGSKNPADHLFTDFTYDNLGLPRNPAIVANAEPAYFDLGLCGPLRERPRGLSDAVCGMFRVPTLRNVARRPFYFHNGSFSDLTEVMRFYVRRDIEPARWYPLDAKGRAQTYNDLPPRFARQVSRDEAPYDRRGRQKPRLNEAEIGDVVAFLRTLDDGFEP